MVMSRKKKILASAYLPLFWDMIRNFLRGTVLIRNGGEQTRRKLKVVNVDPLAKRLRDILFWLWRTTVLLPEAAEQG